MAPVRISSGPEPIMMTPGQLNSGLAPSPVPATTYIPPTDKDREILFQPMFDEYFDQSTDSEPVPTATLNPNQRESPPGSQENGPKDHPLDNIVGNPSRLVSPVNRLQISQSPGGIFINQAKYALETLKKYGMNLTDPVDTPMVDRLKLDEDLLGIPVDQTRFRGMAKPPKSTLKHQTYLSVLKEHLTLGLWVIRRTSYVTNNLCRWDHARKMSESEKKYVRKCSKILGCNRVLERQKKLRNQIFRALTALADVPSSVIETTDTTSTLPPPPPPLCSSTIRAWRLGSGQRMTREEAKTSSLQSRKDYRSEGSIEV
ncbi:hypothetical protein Tco_1368429 [Tanacetum coccineum]